MSEQKETYVKPPLSKYESGRKIDLTGWLKEFETNITDRGYRRYDQPEYGEDFCYVKTYEMGNDKGYQVCVYFYDFRKFEYLSPTANKITLMYRCVFFHNGTEMRILKEIDVPEFEAISQKFYESMVDL